MTQPGDNVAGVSTHLPRSVTIRRGDQNDEQATFEVMRRAMGFEMSWPQHISARRHMRTSPNSSYWVAEDNPRVGRHRIVGYAHSMVRDAVWQLTEFFVLPSHHRMGIGGALLNLCIQDGDEAGAKRRFVLASHHPSADALYIRRAHCLPRVPMLLVAGQSGALRLPAGTAPVIDSVAPPDTRNLQPASAVTGGELLVAQPILPEEYILNEINRLDYQVLGYTRTAEHRHWINENGGPEGNARLFRYTEGRHAGEFAGYCYYGKYSSGPALCYNTADLPRVITHVLSLRRRPITGITGLMDSAEPYWAMSGTNDTVLKWMINCGWNIVYHYLYMSSEPPQGIDHYVCHNPLHFF